MVELRWVVPEHTTTEPPRLQYRNWSEWPAPAGAWLDVPTVVVPEPPKPAPTVLSAYGVAAVPEFDRDADGELLIDWSPNPNRMLTMSLRTDGRLSYAFHWDGEKAHGIAQMPVGVSASGATWEHDCPHSTGAVLLMAHERCTNCGATAPGVMVGETSSNDTRRIDWLNEDHQRLEEVFGAMIRNESDGDLRLILDGRMGTDGVMVDSAPGSNPQSLRSREAGQLAWDALAEPPVAPSYRCVKCGYVGPQQINHQRPNGTGECGYIAHVARGVGACDPAQLIREWVRLKRAMDKAPNQAAYEQAEVEWQAVNRKFIDYADGVPPVDGGQQ